MQACNNKVPCASPVPARGHDTDVHMYLVMLTKFTNLATALHHTRVAHTHEQQAAQVLMLFRAQMATIV